MPYSSLPFPSNLPLESLKIAAVDTVIYVSTTGNDSTGDGTVSAPYRTLSKAMDEARKYVITGSAILTVRLLKGEYTLTDNIDLYHPQGGNLVIEGDPSAFRQRTLYQVESYNWNVGSFAGGGHTGSIRLFDGATNNASGLSAHGFSGTDELTYFCISNAAIGSRSGYETNGASGGFGVYGPTASSYGVHFWGDRFFNHGFSYEDGAGIEGIGRILGASANPGLLTVEFKNMNWDARCPAWAVTGGIDNTGRWCELASNYPETQYSQPVGYYGLPEWKTEDGSQSYPAAPATGRITTDPYILSTYPVVIRAPYNTNTGSLYLKDGKIRAIRNIMFASSAAPYISGSSGLSGATLNWSQGLAAMCFVDKLEYSSNGTGLILENADVGIRHLGFFGMGNAITAYNSTITRYTERTTDTTGSGLATTNQLGTRKFATVGSLDNTPILNVAHCRYGIISKNSDIVFSDSSGLNKEYSVDYSDANTNIQAGRGAIYLKNSDLEATSLTLESSNETPRFTMDVSVPVWTGNDVAGASAAFLHVQNTPSVWTSYPLIKMRMESNAGTQEFAYGYFFRNDNTAYTLGATAGVSTLVYTSPGSVAPTSYQRLSFHGIRSAPHGLSFMRVTDLHHALTGGDAGTIGGTLSIFAYRDAAGTSLAASYVVNNNNLFMQSANGYTYAIRGVTGNGHKFVLEYDQNSKENLRTVSGANGSCLNIRDSSSAVIEKSLTVRNGGYIPVQLTNGSSLDLNDSQVNSNPSTALGEQNGEVNPDDVGFYWNYSTGTLCSTGHYYAAIYAWGNCTVRLGKIFAKHQLIGTRSEALDVTSVPMFTVRGQLNCDLIVSQAFVLFPPGYKTNGTINRIWTTRNGVGWNYRAARAEGAVMDADRNCRGVLQNAGGLTADGGAASVFFFDGGNGAGSGCPAFDGGTTTVPVARNFSFFSADKGSIILVNGVNATTSTATATGFVGTRYVPDTRSNGKINTRETANLGTVGRVYNTSLSGTRYWLAFNGSGAAGAQGSNGVNIGDQASSWSTDGVADTIHAAGLVHNAQIGRGSRILAF